SRAENASAFSDWLGTSTLVGFLGLLMLGLFLGGSTFAWSSWAEVSLFAGRALLFLGFAVPEKGPHEPVLPPRPFRIRNVSAGTAVNRLRAVVSFAIMPYIPLFAAAVLGGRVRPGHDHTQPRRRERRVDPSGDRSEHLRFDASRPARDHAHRRPRDRAGSLLPVDSHLVLGDPRGECSDPFLDSLDETDADGCESGRDRIAGEAPPDLSLISVGDNSRSMVARTRRARITGLGGIFFKARDPKAMVEWYGR